MNIIVTVIYLVLTQNVLVRSTPINQGQIGSTSSKATQQEEVKAVRTIVSKTNYNNEADNPCNVEVEIPDFKKPNRRVSETKCLEYIWNAKERHDAVKRKRDCARYLWSNFQIHEVRHVFGGRVADPGEFPHMGAMGWRGVHGEWIFMCGASIISPKYMVTAAHCSKSSSRDPRLAKLVPDIVRIGAKDIETKIVYNETFVAFLDNRATYPMDVNITKIVTHPRYSPPQQYFDIALIQLEKEVYFDDNVQPACLWNNLNKYNFNKKASVSGWGKTKIGVEETTTELRVGELDIIDNNICNELLRPLCNRHWCGLQEHQMCSGKLAGGVDTCQGDSGGPLQVQIDLPKYIQPKMYYLLGVTSFGFGCAIPNQPGVYSKIASFVDWIEGIVWADDIASGKYNVSDSDA